ncbi:MAG: PAS domain-containing protein, partial [Novosphingobium sp.]|nr:PAS domain-containing protein [Novosphingobium sp.]
MALAGLHDLSGMQTLGDPDWLGLVVDSIADGFGLLAPDFTILRLNSEAYRIDGRPREDLIGRSHWEVYPGTEHSELGKLYKQAMVDRLPVRIEHRYAWPDGRVSDLETRVFPVANGCLAIFYRDVTDQQQMVMQLRASEQRFRAAMAAIEGVLWTNSAEGEMIGEQPAWAALTGQSFDEYQGYGWSRAVHPDDAQPTIDAWNRAVETLLPFAFEHRVRRHDGEWRTFTIRAMPII